MNTFSQAPSALLAVTAFALIVLSGVLTAAEVALSRSTRASVEDLLEGGRRGARRALQVVQTRRETLTSTRAWRVFFQSLAIVSLTMAVAGFIRTWWLVLIVAVLASSLLVLVLGAIVPGEIGRRWPDGVLLSVAPLMLRLAKAAKIWRPLIRGVYRLLPAPAQTEAEARHEVAEEMREMVDQVSETEGIEEEDRAMLRSVFEFGTTLVREVMLPRTEMVTVGEDQTLAEGLDILVDSGFSRIPVVGDDVDEIRGVLYLKDVIRRTREDPQVLNVRTQNVMRTPVFVPEMNRADDVLRHMQEEAVHLVFAVDEYGGISGLLTIEDLVEELVGDLTDEHDHAEPEPTFLQNGWWSVPARWSLDDTGELLGLELEDEDVDSVGGLLAKGLGEVPLVGARTCIGGLELIAEEVSGRRHQVRTVKVRKAIEEDQK